MDYQNYAGMQASPFGWTNMPHYNPINSRFQTPNLYSPPESNIIKVNGRGGMESYPLPPKSQVIAFDENNDIFYMKDTSFEVCRRLADLYICRDELRGRKHQSSPTSSNIGEVSGSEFLEAVSGKDAASVLSVMDEYMDTIKVLYPKVYDTIMNKINSLD